MQELALSLVISLASTLHVSSMLNDPLPTSKENQYKLKTALLAHKSVMARLNPSNDNQVVNIQLMAWPYSILRMDEVEQTIVTLNVLEVTWQDRNLAWNVSYYDGIQFITLDYETIWSPMIAVINSAQEDHFVLTSTTPRVLLHHNGTFVTYMAAYLRTTCSLDLTFYPLDVQLCKLLFTVSFDDCQFNVTAGLKSDLGPDHQDGEWTIVGREMQSTWYPAPKGNLPVVILNLKLRRSKLYYVISVVMPLALTSMMSSLVFWIPPSTGEKVSFLVSIFVSNSVFLSFLVSTMPRSLTEMPRLVLFLSVVMVECFLALLATLFVIRKHEQEEGEKENKHDVTQGRHTGSAKADGRGGVAKPCRLRPAAVQGSGHEVKPLEKFDPVANNTSLNKIEGIFNLKSCQWDMVFFVLYHVTSVPLYIMLFVI